MSLIRICENENWIVDYDKENGEYQVSYFEDGHCRDEIWFDEYKENNNYHTIKTGILKAALVDDNGRLYDPIWDMYYDEFEDEDPNVITIKKKLTPSEIEGIFGTTDLGMLDCSDMTDEEIDRIVEKFNSTPLVNPIRAEDLKKVLERSKDELN